MLKTKEQVYYEHWVEQCKMRAAQRERNIANKQEREELSRPEYTLGVVNKDGQLEFIQAKPVGKTVKRLPEVLAVMVFLFWLFAVMETNIGALK